MKKVLVFGASGSPTSINFQLAKYAAGFLKDLDVTFVDFKDYIPDLIYVEGREKGPIPQQVIDFRKLIDTHDGIIMSLAENNFGPTAAWKSMLDWLSRYIPGDET